MNTKKFNQIKEILKMWESSKWSHLDIFEYNANVYLAAIEAIINDKMKKKT